MTRRGGPLIAPIPLIALACVLLSVSGCSGAGTAGPAAEPSVRPLSPVEEFTGRPFAASQEDLDRELDRVHFRTEDLVAECMKEAGFEYLINPIRSGFIIAQNDDVDNREWVIQNGYGITTLELEFDSDNDELQRQDPNYEYLAKLSPAERSAFDEAMYGQSLTVWPTDLSPAELRLWMNSQGCRNRSSAQAQAESPLYLQTAGEFAPLFEAIGQLNSTIRDSPEMAAINLDWSNCLANAGWPELTRPYDARTKIRTELGNLRNPNNLNYAGPDWQTSPEFGALVEREVELALVDLDCRESINYQQRAADLTYQLETQFVADYQAELTALRAAREQLE